jgi:hypothetical protein
MEVSDQLHVPAALHQEKQPPPHPLDSRLGERQIPSGYFGEEKNLLPLLGIEPKPSAKPVAIPTELLLLLLIEKLYKKRNLFKTKSKTIIHTYIS